jgi:DNA repair photolyase
MEGLNGVPPHVTMQIGNTTKTFEVFNEPVPHILVKGSQKQLHGWHPGRRECTAERMLVNPYNGCSHNCVFCYAHALWTYFQLFRERGIVTVFGDFDKMVARQLDELEIASCGYLSPVTDPFQPVNEKYRLSEKVIKVFVERNLPIEFITKGIISDEVIGLIRQQKHSFGQVSILTLDEDLRRRLVPGGAPTDKLLANLKRMSRAGICAVCRIDPIIPLITDDFEHLSALIAEVASVGAKHVVASCLDLPWKIKKQTIKALATINPKVGAHYDCLYYEDIGYLNADLSYRKELFSEVRRLCHQHGLTFALCMEYELVDGKPKGLNQEFMTSANCEGMDIPLYVRRGEKFVPAADCSGACLNCTSAECGIEDLAMGKPHSKKDWKLADYRRWSKEIKQKRRLSLFGSS